MSLSVCGNLNSSSWSPGLFQGCQQQCAKRKTSPAFCWRTPQLTVPLCTQLWARIALPRRVTRYPYLPGRPSQGYAYETSTQPTKRTPLCRDNFQEVQRCLKRGLGHTGYDARGARFVRAVPLDRLSGSAVAGDRV